MISLCISGEEALLRNKPFLDHRQKTLLQRINEYKNLPLVSMSASLKLLRYQEIALTNYLFKFGHLQTKMEWRIISRKKLVLKRNIAHRIDLSQELRAELKLAHNLERKAEQKLGPLCLGELFMSQRKYTSVNTGI